MTSRSVGTLSPETQAGANTPWRRQCSNYTSVPRWHKDVPVEGFEEFIASARYVSDLGDLMGDEFLDGIGGWVYGDPSDHLFIEATRTWPVGRSVTEQWYMTVGGEEFKAWSLSYSCSACRKPTHARPTRIR